MFYDHYVSIYGGIAVGTHLSTNYRQSLPFRSTSSNRTAQAASSLSSTTQYTNSSMACAKRCYSYSSPISSMVSSASAKPPMSIYLFPLSGVEYQTAGFNYRSEGSGSTMLPEEMGIVDVINFYTLAEELFGEKIAWGDTQASGYRRPNNPIGELTPVGDAILPLMACVIVYAIYKIRRKINLRKARNV